MTFKTIVLFLAHALGTPLIFFIGFFSLSKTVENTTKLNALLYIPLAIIFYAVWNAAVFLTLNHFKPELKFQTYLEMKYHWWALLACVTGLFAILVAGTDGIEANIFGFVFALPLLVSQISLLVLFVMNVMKFVK